MVVHSCWRIYFIGLSDLTKVQIYFKHILNGFENGLKEKNFKRKEKEEKENPHLSLSLFWPQGLAPSFSPRPTLQRPLFSPRSRPVGHSAQTAQRPRPSQARRFPLPPLADESAPHRESLPGGIHASATRAFLLARAGSEQDSTPVSKNPDTPGISYPCTHRTAINP